MHRPTSLLLAAALSSAAFAAAAADLPAPGGVPDLVGPRALAVSAGIGLASGNDGLFLNPAALAARKRYSVETSAFIDRRGSATVAEVLGGSVVDSLTGPVTAGLSYSRAFDGDYKGNLIHVALAGPIVEGLYLGATGKWYSLNEVQALAGGVERTSAVSAATADAGLFWQVAPYVSVGAAAYNLVSIANPRVAPRSYGAGLTIGSDRVAQITADWRADLDRREETTNRYGVGGEVLLGGLVPLRAGYARDETIGASWWSIGAGFVSRSGVAIDVAYRQTWTRSRPGPSPARSSCSCSTDGVAPLALRRRGGAREAEREDRAAARRVRRLDRPAILLDVLARQREPEPRALRPLRREERLEEVGSDARRDAGPVVRDGHDDVARVVHERHAHVAIAPPGPLERVGGVHEQVHERLHEAGPRHAHRARGARHGRGDARRARDPHRREPDRLVDGLGRVARLRAYGRPERREEGRDDPGRDERGAAAEPGLFQRERPEAHGRGGCNDGAGPGHASCAGNAESRHSPGARGTRVPITDLRAAAATGARRSPR